MPLPILPPYALRYLIGGNDRYPQGPQEIVEYGYDAQRGETGYCTLTSEKERFNSLAEANATGRYAPYLPPSDITGDYGEWCPDPRGDGFMRNVSEQIERRAGQGFVRIEWDNPDFRGLELGYVLTAHDLAWQHGLRTIAKNPLNVRDPAFYMSHPSIDLVIVERGEHGSDDMDLLRRAIRQPYLAVRFVGYCNGQNDRAWCESVAATIRERNYKNMGVTLSPMGEYNSSQDIQLPLPWEETMPTRIAISSGHGKYIRGARGNPVPPQLDEVDEARRIVDRVAEMLGCPKFHDNTSHDQSTNLNTIVNWHNKQSRDLDVSVHFNAYNHTAQGTEVLYITQEDLAADVSAAICAAGGFTNRGAKYRSDLFFLNNTNKPAILLETCFCDHTGDSNKYNAKFDEICSAIAETIGGEPVQQPPEAPGEPPSERPPIIEPPGQKPMIGRGDNGPYVESVQRSLGLPVDGDFGALTEAGVRGFQKGYAPPADGVVGPTTWEALDALDRQMAAGSEGLSKQLEAEIERLAEASPLMDYSWEGRGQAPPGYYAGMAKTYAVAVQRYNSGDAAARIMGGAETGDPATDALSYYAEEFADENMDNTVAGIDTLRHLFVMLVGLGMRESSGNHWVGRDMSASNVESDTAEAGLLQTSWNIRTASSTISDLFDEFDTDPNGFRPTFGEGLEPSTDDLDNYGSGEGAQYQWLAKYCPCFAVLVTAVGLRLRRQHWGPIGRREVEIVPMVDDLLVDVERAMANA